MANIALTKYCNLHCPYCFASDMISEEDKKNISIDTFKMIMDWIVNNPTKERIGLIGGEPTLHPQFSEILDICQDYYYQFGNDMILYTNGIELKQYLDKIHERMSILINFNNPQNMDFHKYIKLYDCLDELNRRGMLGGQNPQAHLGCNLCLDFNNYNFFWKAVEKYNIITVRVSCTAPIKQEYKNNKDKYYKEIKPIFLNFVDKAIETNTIIKKDCNQIPSCYFTEEELIKISKVCNDELNILCSPAVDITPDFTATSCFGTYEYPIDCTQFITLDELKHYFFLKVIAKKIEGNKCGQCCNCNKFNFLQCQGGCLSFSGV